MYEIEWDPMVENSFIYPMVFLGAAENVPKRVLFKRKNRSGESSNETNLTYPGFPTSN